METGAALSREKLQEIERAHSKRKAETREGDDPGLHARAQAAIRIQSHARRMLAATRVRRIRERRDSDGNGTEESSSDEGESSEDENGDPLAVDLRDCKVRTDDARILAHALSHMPYVSMPDTINVSGAALPLRRIRRRAKRLDLSGCDLCAADIIIISELMKRNSRLTELDLKLNNISGMADPRR